MPTLTRRAWIVLAAIAVAIALLSWWYSTRTPDSAPTAAPPATAETPPQVSNPPTAPPRPGTATQPPPAEPLTGVDPVLSQARDASIQIATSGRDQLRARYDGEPADARWARAKEQALASLSTSEQIDALGVTPLAFDASCRSTTCRIHADFPTRRTAEDWFTLYTLEAVAHMSNVSVQTLANADGGVRLELYGFARPPTP